MFIVACLLAICVGGFLAWSTSRKTQIRVCSGICIMMVGLCANDGREQSREWRVRHTPYLATAWEREVVASNAEIRARIERIKALYATAG